MTSAELVANVIVVVIVAILCIYCGVAIYTILDLLLHRLRKKRLCQALIKIIISYSENKSFDNTMAELEFVIQTIIKNDKKFPQSCRVPSGLLKQYIYWLNIDVAQAPDSAACIALKEAAHELIRQYNNTPYSSEANLYNEPLINTVSQHISKHEWENTNKCLTDLDIMIDKERKKASFVRNWVPPISTILGAIITAVLTALF